MNTFSLYNRLETAMRLGRFTFILSTFALLSVPVLAADRVALVIGNGAYQRVPALPNPPRDAADIAHALERLDFKVTQLTNATAADMRKALVEFGHAAEGSLMAVVFYAGHGMEAGGENWLVPTDAELRSDSDIESEAVSLRSVNLQVSKARQLGLIILDACRNNPFAAKMKRSLSTRAVARGLVPTEPTDNVLVAYAARDGTTASDGDGRNSPFTTALLRNIETPGLEISFLFRRVRDDVMSATKREQQPFVYGSLSKEEIYLKAPAASASPIANVSTPPTLNQTTAAPAEDEQFWQAIKTSTVAGLYEEFLSIYPKSKHVVEARERIKDLRSKPAAAASSTTIASRSDNDTTITKDGVSSPPKSPDRSLFTSEDSQRVATVGAKQQLKMPPFTIAATQGDSLDSYSRFVGVWSSKRGWGDGKGRYGMLIITEVSATGLARGYYLWGPPTKLSWNQGPAGYVQFAEYIANDTFSFKSGQPINAKLNKNNIMALSSFRPEKPSEKSGVEFHPIWQLAALGHDATEPSVGRGQASRKSRETSITNPSPTQTREPQPRADQEPRQATKDSRCNRMHDQLGCLCAVQNGGGISLDGKTWYSKRNVGDPTNEAFVQCQLRAGRR